MHTPTPWDTDIVRDKLNYCYRIGFPTGTVEVRTDAGETDAALIVKAVNSYAAQYHGEEESEANTGLEAQLRLVNFK